MNDKWISFDTLPTTNPGEQVNIIFMAKGWSTFFRGLYTHYPDEDLRYCLSKYVIEDDKFYEWESKLPTHYIILPKNLKDE